MKGNQKINQPNELFEMLPQAIAALKKNIIDPIFGENKTDKYANERPPLRSELLRQSNWNNMPEQFPENTSLYRFTHQNNY